MEEGEAYEVRTSAAYRLYGQWCEKYGYHTENVKNFNSAISRHFEIRRKRPDDGSGSVTTMIIGCRFLESENGEATDAGCAANSGKAASTVPSVPPLLQD